jgi:A/G-specific adenine glycosylase
MNSSTESSALDRAVDARKASLRRGLRAWARQNLRNFPWRGHRSTPYKVLVAELLLKRTTAAAAERLYPSFVERFPNVAALGTASIAELKCWFASVGLQAQRARFVSALAAAISRDFSGRVPGRFEELLGLPGLGEYSARAVISFGHGKHSAPVDSNVSRVWRRVFGGAGSNVLIPSVVQSVADRLTPIDSHRTFNYALLDLAATVCRYSRPRCMECPLAESCDSRDTFGATGKSATPLSRLRARRL